MNKIPENLRQQLTALSAMPDSDIDLSDIPETTPQQWLGASRGQFYRPIKTQLTVRIDSDVLEWLKSQGKGYQSRLNQILRTAMMDNVRP
jgi:uncharacterized protein (DUF4415 family)